MTKNNLSTPERGKGWKGGGEKMLEMLGGRYLQGEEGGGGGGGGGRGGGRLWMDLGWTATGLVDGCSRCGSVPSPYVFI